MGGRQRSLPSLVLIAPVFTHILAFGTKYCNYVYFLSLPGPLPSRTDTRVWSSCVLPAHTALNNSSLASQVTLISVVPNKELLVSGFSGNVRTDHQPHRCAGAIWGLLSGKEIYFTWAFCPWESSLKSSPKSKRQVAKWSDALPSETESQRSSAQPPQGLPFSPGEW